MALDVAPDKQGTKASLMYSVGIAGWLGVVTPQMIATNCCTVGPWSRDLFVPHILRTEGDIDLVSLPKLYWTAT